MRQDVEQGCCVQAAHAPSSGSQEYMNVVSPKLSSGDVFNEMVCASLFMAAMWRLDFFFRPLLFSLSWPEASKLFHLLIDFSFQL
jgi:hypothetical protein